MTTLKQHKEARRVGQVLSNLDRDTFLEGLSRTHEEIAFTLPEGLSEAELFAVVQDRLESHGLLTPDEYSRFRLLRKDVRDDLTRTAVRDGGAVGSSETDEEN